ncbi:hypothetical protein T492DRAFT_883127 [Pavlovales sp. CCMP2436]|nr:hypothetical protein T492DRAFT_883127 [Pavlovales sp. CCMP2436]
MLYEFLERVREWGGNDPDSRAIGTALIGGAIFAGALGVFIAGVAIFAAAMHTAAAWLETAAAIHDEPAAVQVPLAEVVAQA